MNHNTRSPMFLLPVHSAKADFASARYPRLQDRVHAPAIVINFAPQPR